MDLLNFDELKKKEKGASSEIEIVTLLTLTELLGKVKYRNYGGKRQAFRSVLVPILS